MDEKLEFMKISKKENMTDVMSKVLKKTVSGLVNKGEDVSEFECTYDDEKTYQFLWKQKWNGYGYFMAFVEPNEVRKFIKESKKYVNVVGFDPLNPRFGMEIITRVYVYSPNSFPEKEIKSLLSVIDEKEGHKDTYVVLVSTNKVIKEYRSNFSSEK